MSVVTEEAECAEHGEPVAAAQLPSDIALQKPADNKVVACAEDGELVIQEPELALVGTEDAMPAEVLPADECSVVGFPQRTKLKSESSATKRSAVSEMGAAAKKQRGGAAFVGTAKTDTASTNTDTLCNTGITVSFHCPRVFSPGFASGRSCRGEVAYMSPRRFRRYSPDMAALQNCSSSSDESEGSELQSLSDLPIVDQADQPMQQLSESGWFAV